MSQLALPLSLADHAVFGSFLDTGNETLVATLAGLAGAGPGAGCWLWGLPATGKTHLLQAVCERAGDRSVYLPLSRLSGADPGLLEGLASRELICLDDLEAVAGAADWELALFGLINQILDGSRRLVVAAAMPPRQWLPIFQVRPLADSDRAAALQLRARHRGLELPDDTARYLLSHSQRDMKSLYRLLDTLDRESLRAQRRLTIPFVRDVLQSL